MQAINDGIDGFNEEERARIEKALAVCGSARTDGDTGARNEGAAATVAAMGLDADCVIAALLFDTCKTDADRKRIAAGFGENAAALAASTAKVLKLSAKEKSIAEAEKIRKMLFAMIEDIRVIFICLAEKLQTMRSIDAFRPAERKVIAQECLDIYAPLASRLGISWLKDEIEDLCLKQINADAFRQISGIVALKKSEREDFLNFVKRQVTEEAERLGLEVEVYSRAKHFYSIYQKMRKRNKEAGDLYDLFGLRIICGSVENCYTLLGMTHRLWKPIDGRFKDYIAMPKSNGYQSLHTTVLAFDSAAYIKGEAGGNMLEIQIRTAEMHRTAEFGYASHWLYKKGMSAERVRESDLPLVNTLMHIAAGFDDSPLEEIKKEMLKDSIFVFTPQGKVVELPQGATPIDFAYSIHTAIGEHCLLAKADGAIVPLGAPLRNTQIVEIGTSQNAHPHRNWERLVKTAKARNKIRAWLAANDEAARSKAAARKKPEDRREEKQPVRPRPAANADNAFLSPLRVLVQHERNMLFRFAKCCKPVPGDAIVGYVSRGRGIIIHRKDCTLLPHIAEFDQRRIDTEWDE
jgi:GTP pyrophosphokinase